MTEQADNDVDRLRAAIGGYFRAAAALAEASLLIRRAALVNRDDPDEADTVDWLLDRAATYQEKSELMSRSAAILLVHTADWLDNLDREELEWDEETILAQAGRTIDEAAQGYADTVDALTTSSFGGNTTYQELLDELRLGARFLQGEAARFSDHTEDIEFTNDLD